MTDGQQTGSNHEDRYAADRSDADRYAAGRQVRSEVLGAEHVAAAEAATTPFTADFQSLLTRYAWGEVWPRPGLDRRTRSVATLTALLALRHWEEFALHVRAAVRNGLTADEIGEVLLHGAVYCGVPAANRGFAIAQRMLREGAQEPQSDAAFPCLGGTGLPMEATDTDDDGR